MKKMISLAVILSCVLSAQAFADGPNDGHRPGQQQVWQNGPKQGDQNGHHQPGGPGDNHQGNNDSRGPTEEVMTIVTVNAMNRTISPGG